MRLLSQHERRLYAYVLSLVMNWADADEIVQETNVRLWEQFDEYRPGSDFGAWACTIAYYQVLSHRNRTRGGQVHFGGRFFEAVAEEMTHATVEMDERLRALAGCLERLSEPNRSLIQRCYAGGASIREIAEQLGRSQEATYKAVSRIRRTLHDCIEGTLREEAE